MAYFMLNLDLKSLVSLIECPNREMELYKIGISEYN